MTDAQELQSVLRLFRSQARTARAEGHDSFIYPIPGLPRWPDLMADMLDRAWAALRQEGYTVSHVGDAADRRTVIILPLVDGC